MGDQVHGGIPWWLLTVEVLSRVGPSLLLWLVCLFVCLFVCLCIDQFKQFLFQTQMKGEVEYASISLTFVRNHGYW